MVNGKRCSRIFLKDGDELAFGEFAVEFKLK